jgi:hypothetical protein
LVIAGLLALTATGTSIGAENGSFTEEFFLIRLDHSLGEARRDGTFPLSTGVPAVDELIADEGVHRIGFAATAWTGPTGSTFRSGPTCRRSPRDSMRPRACCSPSRTAAAPRA